MHVHKFQPALLFVCAALFMLSVTLPQGAAALNVEQCPEIPVLSAFGGIDAGPEPNVTLTIDNGQLRVVANVSYLGAQDATWVVDFSPFDPATRAINNPTTCENRLNSSFDGVPFSDFWNAANTSSVAGALNSTTYLAYPPSIKWTQSPNGCAGVTYVWQRPLSDLVACRDANNSLSVSYAYNAQTKTITYSGKVYVSLVRPVDRNSHTAGYTRVQHAYPFNIEVQASHTVIASATSGSDFKVSLFDVATNASNHLIIQLRTTLAGQYDGHYLFSPAVTSGPSGHVLWFPTSRNVAVNATEQIWTIESHSDASAFTGTYTLRWNVSSGGYLSADVRIEISATPVQDIPLSLSTSATMYKDAAFTSTGSTVGPQDKVALRMALSTAQGDSNNFDLSLQNLWVCFAQGGAVPTYDPPNSYGCSQASSTVLAANIKQLVASGSTAGAPSGFNPVVVPSGTSGIASNEIGVYFDASAISSTAGVYFVHIETLISQRTPAGVIQSVLRRRLLATDAQKRGQRDNLLPIVFVPGPITPGPGGDGNGNNGTNSAAAAIEQATSATGAQDEGLVAAVAVASSFGGLSIIGGVVLLAMQMRKKRLLAAKQAKQGPKYRVNNPFINTSAAKSSSDASAKPESDAHADVDLEAAVASSGIGVGVAAPSAESAPAGGDLLAEALSAHSAHSAHDVPMQPLQSQTSTSTPAPTASSPPADALASSALVGAVPEDIASQPSLRSQPSTSNE